MNRNKKIAILVGLLAVAGIVAGVAWTNSGDEPTQYELVQPANRDIVRQISMPGELQPRSEINIKPQITGIISELCVQEGDVVKVGDVVAKVQVIPDMSSLNAAQNAVNTSQLVLEETQREYARTKDLFEHHVVSQEEFDQMQNSLNMAKENLETARASRDIITAGSSKRSGKINTTIVRSPINGTLLSILTKPGASVVSTNTFGEGSTIATVADMRQIQFLGYVNEAEVEDIKVGMPITLTVPAMHNLQIPATLTFIAPKETKSNGAVMYAFKADAQLADSVRVRAGYSASATFILEQHKDVLSVEASDVYYEGMQAFVKKLTSNPDSKSQSYELVPVELGLNDGAYVEILSGITANDYILGDAIK